MITPTIYLDMDGVLCDFVTPAMELLDPTVVIEIPRGNPYMTDWYGISHEEFWRRIHSGGIAFWENLEKYSWTDDLIEFCESISNVYILTSHGGSDRAAAGKCLWIDRHFPRLRNKIIITENKHLLAKPDAILIDDTDTKIYNFHMHGGRTILFPQRWNTFNCITDPLAFVKKELGGISNLYTGEIDNIIEP